MNRTSRILQLALQPSSSSNTKHSNLHQNNNYLCSDYSEDDDDSVKDKKMSLSDVDISDSDSNIEDKDVEQEYSDIEDNLPISEIKKQCIERNVREVLSEIIEKVSNNLESTLYTKKGTLRKRKKYETSPKTRKQLKLSERIMKYSSVKENCNEKCKKKCTKNISRERQEQINKQFWGMTERERRAFILHNTVTTDVKRRSVNITAEGSRRNRSVSYSLSGENGQNYPVCKQMFLATLGFELKNDRVLRNVTLTNCCRGSIIPKPDNRGRKQKENKFNEKLIEDHIQSFQPTISHYRREHAPLRKYLPSDITIRIMHKDFLLKSGSTISYELYRKVVARMNISFSNLGHEECFVCESFNLHCGATGHNKQDISENCEICSSFKKHQDGYRMAREEYKQDALKKDGLYVSADLQKVTFRTNEKKTY